MILEVAKRLGYTPIRCGRVYRDKVHDSLIFFEHTDSYYRYSQKEGGNIYNLVINTLNCDFKTAIEFLKKENIILNNDFEHLKNDTIEERKFLKFPKHNVNSDKMIDYLHNIRKINKSVIFDLISRKIIYEDINHNMCFIGKNLDGKVKNIQRRSLIDKEFSTVSGSSKKYPFFIENNNYSLVITEGEIDSISMYELFGKKHTYIALSGLSDSGLINFINERNLNNIVINLCLDNDEPGMEATKRISKNLETLDKNFIIKDISSKIYKIKDVKDTNDILKIYKLRKEKQIE